MRLLCVSVMALASSACFAQLTKDDAAVIEAASLAILHSPDFRHMSGKGSKLVLVEKTPEKIGFLRTDQINADLAPRQLDDGILMALWERNAAGTGWQGRKASYGHLKLPSNIVIGKLPVSKPLKGTADFLKMHPQAKGWFQPYLPAYSPDESLAVVRGLAGPWAHAASATVLLQRDADKWIVQWVRIAYYA